MTLTLTRIPDAGVETHTLTLADARDFDPWAAATLHPVWAACSCSNPDGDGVGGHEGFFRSEREAGDWHHDHLLQAWKALTPEQRDAQRRESSESAFYVLFTIGWCRNCGDSAIAAEDGYCIVCEGGRLVTHAGPDAYKAARELWTAA